MRQHVEAVFSHRPKDVVSDLRRRHAVLEPLIVLEHGLSVLLTEGLKRFAGSGFPTADCIPDYVRAYVGWTNDRNLDVGAPLP